MIKTTSLIKITIVIAVLHLMAASMAHAQNANQEWVNNVLHSFTAGNDPFLNKAISPAKSTNVQLSDYDRTVQMNRFISGDLAKILNAFDAASEADKFNAVVAASQAIDPNFKNFANAQIQFVDGSPSLIIARTLYIIDKRSNTASEVLDTYTSYKRSAKPSDYVYEYADPYNLTQGNIRSSEGSANSWLKPNAAAPMRLNEKVALKKCRSILMSWKCNTSLVQVGQNGNTKYIISGNYSLVNNPDNGAFGNDGRTKNQVDGSTALFVVKESANWILLTGVDVSWLKSSLSFQSIIRSEFQKDAQRFATRLNTDLKR